VKLRLNPDWTEFLSLLISKRVRFVLVGDHAVAAHGEPRLTEDLDVFVNPTLANAVRLREALLAFGFGIDVPSVKQLVVPGSIWMLGRKPWRIDVLNKIDGVSFTRAWNGRVKADFRPEPLYLIGRKELIANKRASGRDKDLRDVAMLESLAPPLTQRTRRKGSKGSKGSKKPFRQ
jgi:hypothetical protein